MGKWHIVSEINTHRGFVYTGYTSHKQWGFVSVTVYIFVGGVGKYQRVVFILPL